MKTQTVILIGIIIFAAIIGYLGYTYLQTQVQTSTIQTEGSSQIISSPDRARVWVGVSILKTNARDAQDAENIVIKDIVQALKNFGIPETDVETESLSLYEEKIWTQAGEKSNGWRATQNLKVKTDDFSKVGKIVDAAVNNGANQINNIEFYLSPSKEIEIKKQAIEEATKNARAKAEAMASGSGSKLGKVKSLSENNYYATPYIYRMKNDVGSGAVEESATVLPQDITTTASVSIIYELK